MADLVLIYSTNSTGTHTEASYRDDTGHPCMARFAGHWPEDSVRAYVLWARRNDRGASP